MEYVGICILVIESLEYMEISTMVFWVKEF